MPDEKLGILLVHGFGASGAQWNKALQALRQTDAVCSQGLAPDLLGFGQSEKPAISYTSYLWDSQMMDFAKEIALHRHEWTCLVTGGNSIGGYTSMSLAACDAATGTEVSSSGAPGTGRCIGLVLMNSAGPVKTRDEVQAGFGPSMNNGPWSTVAQATATQALPVCKPPPRPIARLFGNVLLAYLRPRIQSICRNLYPTNPAAVNSLLCTQYRNRARLSRSRRHQRHDGRCQATAAADGQ
jgi:pimeloyl-ACP methyl ester carboxylesterase